MLRLRLSRRQTGLAGAALLAAPLALRAAGSATATSASFAGRAFTWACPIQLLSGFPCPGCGMTRSLLLSAGGDLSGAWALNPGGPLLLLGVILAGAALLSAALVPTGRITARLRSWGGAYLAACSAVMLVHWVWELA